ncbi:MAG: NUDIX domain-containing protein [Firmicutes bacterium]|nr:NUDIX domain-containing protein [Bacillota bacterium]
MDISVELENYNLNVRTCAFIRCKGEILVCEHKNKNYYTLPGGRVKVGEDSKEALLRELKEELNYDLGENDLRITRVIENFFVCKSQNIHEYLFVYLCDLDESLYNGDFKNLENYNITMNWVKEEAFILLNVEPGVVKGIIRNPNVEHIVLKDI